VRLLDTREGASTIDGQQDRSVVGSAPRRTSPDRVDPPVIGGGHRQHRAQADGVHHDRCPSAGAVDLDGEDDEEWDHRDQRDEVETASLRRSAHGAERFVEHHVGDSQ